MGLKVSYTMESPGGYFQKSQHADHTLDQLVRISKGGIQASLNSKGDSNVQASLRTTALDFFTQLPNSLLHWDI